MTLSKVGIFNITLNILGVSTPLERSNLTDTKAILLNNYYDLALEHVLRSFDWNFASCFRELSLKKENKDYMYYRYSFDYPNDCVAARGLFQKGDYALQKFSIASSDDGERIILTNIEKPILRYTRKVEKEIYFTPEFTMALAFYLASLSSNVITGSNQKAQIAYQKYQELLSCAKIINAQEDSENLYDETTYLDSRD